MVRRRQSPQTPNGEAGEQPAAEPARPPVQELDPDEPIQTPDEDRLGHKSFAAALASTIRMAPRGAGFVIGLAGPWGSGKTSIVNMATTLLRGDDSLTFLQFNPW